MDAALTAADAALAAITRVDPASADYQNTFLALESATDLLNETWAKVTHLTSVADAPELRAAHNAALPKVSAFQAKIPLNAALWNRLNFAAQHPSVAALRGEHRRFVQETTADFRQQGADLPPDRKARLEALWVMPSRVMETLEASLFRRDETEEAFDLPAYRELLFLYAVARDFAHKADDGSAVDLLLPMDTDAPSAPVSRLVASMPGIIANRGAGVAKSGSEAAQGPDSKLDDGSLSLEMGPLDLVEDPLKPGSIIRR